MDQALARLLSLLKQRSWREGPVVLASGKTSNFYIDCKQTTLHAEGALLVGELLFERIQNLRQKGIEVAAVGGLTLGADPMAVATAVASQQAGAPLDAFVIRKEPKGHGTGQWIEGGKWLAKGTKVVILEDVVTTGGSTLKALERARASELEPVAVLALVDRQEGGAETIVETGLPFEALLARTDFETSA